MRIKKIGILLIVMLLITVPILADEQDDTTNQEKEPAVAAVVNEEKITVPQLDQYINLNEIIMGLYQNNKDFTTLILTTDAGTALLNEYRKQKIDGLIQMKLLIQETEKRGIELSKESIDEIFNEQYEYMKESNGLTDDKLLEELKKQGFESLEAFKTYFFDSNTDTIRITELQKSIIEPISVDDVEAQTYYNDNLDKYKHDDLIKASHILLDDEMTAKEILEKVNNGADFAETAKEYSTGPTGKNGGDLGYIESSNENYDKTFKDAAFALEEGQVSGIVKTQFGYHIIKVFKKEPAGTQPFEEVKDDIINGLTYQKRSETWNNFMEKLWDEANIQIKL